MEAAAAARTPSVAVTCTLVLLSVTYRAVLLTSSPAGVLQRIHSRRCNKHTVLYTMADFVNVDNASITYSRHH